MGCGCVKYMSWGWSTLCQHGAFSGFRAIVASFVSTECPVGRVCGVYSGFSKINGLGVGGSGTVFFQKLAVTVDSLGFLSGFRHSCPPLPYPHYRVRFGEGGRGGGGGGEVTPLILSPVDELGILCAESKPLSGQPARGFVHTNSLADLTRLRRAQNPWYSDWTWGRHAHNP